MVLKEEMTHRISLSSSMDEVKRDYAVFFLDSLATIKRYLPVIAVLVGAAPLTGLLGTVSGMLATFQGMADSMSVTPMDTISLGVSEALVTTQFGLVIGIPGAVLFSLLRSQVRGLELECERRLSKRLLGLAP